MTAQADPNALQGELALVMQSPEFVRSPVLRRLLEYLVEQTLAGHGERLKAYQIAVEGLGRDDSFDPQSDSYPRVQVGRLRKMLDLHYAALAPDQTAGRQRITIPVGHYNVELTPVFASPAGTALPPATSAAAEAEGRSVTLSPAPPRGGVQPAPPAPALHSGMAAHPRLDRGWLAWALPAIVLFALLYAIWLFGHSDDAARPNLQAQIAHVTIATDPGTGSDDLNTAAQIAEMHLQRFEMLAVSMGDHADGPATRDTAREYQLLLRGGGRDPAGNTGLIFLTLRHGSSGTTLWSYELPRNGSRMASADFEQAIGAGVSVIARSGGVIAQHQRKLIGTDASPGYPCLIQYDAFRQRRDKTKRPQLHACLEQSLARYPDEPLLLQALSYLTLSEPQRRGQRPLAPSEEGRALAEAALQFDGRSSLAQIAVARSALARGNCPRAIAFSRRAVESNPLEPDTLGIAGALLLSCGDYAGSQAVLERAYAMNNQQGGFQTAALVLARVVNGQQNEALDLANRAETPELDAHPDFLLAKSLAQAANGRAAQARTTWAKLEKAVGVPAGTRASEVVDRFALSPFFSRRMAAEAERTGLVQAAG